MVDYLQTLTDSKQNHFRILEITAFSFWFSEVFYKVQFSRSHDFIRICRVLYYVLLDSRITVLFNEQNIYIYFKNDIQVKISNTIKICLTKCDKYI